MHESKRAEHRSRVLIDRGFQLGLIGRMGGMFAFYLLLFLVISILAPMAFTFLGDPPEWALMETSFRIDVLLRLFLAPLLCTFLCMFAHGVLETFKIAGPNFRFKAVMKDLARMRLPRGVRIRKDDYLQETASEFDAALVALHERVRSLKERSGAASRKVGAALGSSKSEAAQDALAAVALVDEELATFELCGQAPTCEPLPPSVDAVEPVPQARTPVGAT